MKRLHKINLFAGTALLLGVAGFIPALAAQDSGRYEQGLELQKTGKWQEALNTWLAALDSVTAPVDPRIGFAFIELATAQQAEAFYPQACELYLQAFATPDIDLYKKAYEEELRRLQPILSENQYKAWQAMLKNANPDFGREIIDFWRKKDPTPSTEHMNERLIEHWKRIAFARKNFTETQNTVYKTDDRGLLYVRFGPPDYWQSGILGRNRFAFLRWADMLDSMRGGTIYDREEFLRAIATYNTMPEYEIWIYKHTDEGERPFYVFGRDEGQGSFGLRKGVEDFIPDRAFRRTNTRYSGGLLPGSVLQTVYYGELAHLHRYFADRYSELDREWENSEMLGISKSSYSVFRGKRKQFEQLQLAEPDKWDLPADRSTFQDGLILVALTIQPVRILNVLNQPTLAVVMISSPEYKRRHLDLSGGSIRSRAESIHTLRIYDTENNLLQRRVDRIVQRLDNTSTFSVPHDSTQASYEMIAEIFSEAVADSAGTRDLEHTKLLGYNRAEFSSDPPLSPEPDQLELSDLVIGVEKPDTATREKLPFPVVPSNEIYHSDILHTYLEIYHLQPGEDGIGRYHIVFVVSKFKGRKKSKKESISLSFDLEAAESRAAEPYGIDISNLDPGDYELRVEVTDTISGQSKHRTAPFTILDNEKTKSR